MTAAATTISQPISSEAASSGQPSKRTLRGLDCLNFLLADVQTGVGPFLAIYLAQREWNAQNVGLALTVGGIAGVVTQAPIGALVDRTRYKRGLIAAGVIALAVGALAIALAPTFWIVLAAQSLIGGTASIYIPAIAAISLGVVGHKLFDRRQGRNQAFNSAGNVFAAAAIALIGYYTSNRDVFFFVIALSIPTLLSLLLIRPEEIDYDLARNLSDGDDDGRPERVKSLWQDHRLLIFLTCAVLFHFANAAMLPLLGELLSADKGRASMAFMAACVITTQLVITFTAPWYSRIAGAWGRKPLLLIGFAVLPIRGVLYTTTSNPTALVLIQILDGIGAGIFNVVSILVIADLTRGTGRFNFAQGAIGAAVGAGAALSQVIAGSIVHHTNYATGFLFLSAIAAIAFAILWLLMPETLQTERATS